MDRRSFLKSLFAVAAATAVPAQVAAAIEQLEQVVALPEEVSPFSIQISFDEGKAWLTVPCRGTVNRENGWVSCDLVKPVEVPSGALIRMSVNEAAWGGGPAKIHHAGMTMKAGPSSGEMRVHSFRMYAVQHPVVRG
jgi:hypothetical protein